ncbi:DUF262 domain-containing protein [Komagataeibacter europaeus]|uniref:DUF262 domain-containing protein n=1 Tax=Komagataeibacter europaeus TaxID=33995 RepID=UPI000237E487|nr:DUF262 domain-containing protein [Komagataeibacter europaeus]
MNTSISRVETRVQKINDICSKNALLEIPCYQRPYVWPERDVKKILQDIRQAMDRGQEQYFIGTLITASHGHQGGHPFGYELIDGQQRMTTLFLIALAYSALKPDSALAQFARRPGDANDIRLNFAIREQVQDLLRSWLNGVSPPALSIEDPYVKCLVTGLAAASAFLMERQESGDLEAFGHYLFNCVQWVNNIVPSGTDLNQLFTALNTNGVQLEASDILKARLLEMVPAHQRMSYDAIWQACENMNGFFEDNLRQVFPDANWQKYTYHALKVYDADRFKLDESNLISTPALSIQDILATQAVQDGSTRLAPTTGKEAHSYRAVRSIITFPELLLHVLLIYICEKPCKLGAKKEKNIFRIHPDRLNESFDPFLKDLNAQDAQGFIECLWTTRHQFDQWVMKRIPDADNNLYCVPIAPEHEEDKKSKISRTMPGHDGTPFYYTALAQLQSVRYFTGEHAMQYWLTPFLGRLCKNDIKDVVQVTDLLKTIDNQLSCAQDQKKSSFDLLSGTHSSEIQESEIVITDLMNKHYPSISHYWFQKLEYILWNNAAQGPFPAYLEKDKFKAYRITSKNSVEHIFPQNPTSSHNMDEDILHGFGNLALINPSENSTYSNRIIIEKREMFLKKPKYDSLKLAHMFFIIRNKPYSDLGEKDIIQHKEEMEYFIRQYYGIIA